MTSRDIITLCEIAHDADLPAETRELARSIAADILDAMAYANHHRPSARQGSARAQSVGMTARKDGHPLETTP